MQRRRAPAYGAYRSAPILDGCAIVGNTAIDSGGGVYCSYSSPTIRNCTIVNNTAMAPISGPNGGGVHLADSTALITNCIIWGNTSPQIREESSLATVTYSDIQGGWDGAGNIDIDPLLVADGVHLTAGSPCIASGDPNAPAVAPTDVDGEARVGGGRVDMGADEFFDADADELPDWWEEDYFAGPTAASPVDNDDGDGLANLEEYLERHNPLRPPISFYVDVAGNDAWGRFGSDLGWRSRPEGHAPVGGGRC